MPDTPNYRFNRHPQFSVNHLADYLATTTAEQRERVIRAAKFPKKIPVSAYTQAKRTIGYFLSANTGDLSYFDAPISRFETRRRREPEGWMRDEMQRCIDAIGAFKRTFSKSRLSRFQFGPQVDLSMRINDVRLNTRLDASISHTDRDDVLRSGGCVLFLASTDPARKNIEARRRSVAAMIYWSLEGGNIDPLPRLCLSFDVFGETVVRAPEATDRLRGQISSACREAATQWSRIEPPADYDGPDWR